MKKVFKIIGVLYLILLLVTPAWAAGENAVGLFRFGGDLFGSGDKVSFAENVKGDRYVSGGEIDVSGETGGDIIAAGGRLNLAGTTKGNIRAAGGELHITGTIDKNVTVAGGTVVVERDAVIRGNLMVAGGRVAVAGKVLGTAMLAAEKVELNGQLGATKLHASELQVGPSAVINGDLTYTVSKATVAPEAQIKGATEETIVQPEERQKTKSNPFMGSIISAVGAMILVLLLAYLFPRPTGTAVSALQSNWGKQLVVGLAFLFGFVILFVLLAFTVIGLPVAFLSLIFYIFAILFSVMLWLPLVSLWFGELLHNRFPGTSRILAAVVAVLLLSLVRLTPVLGAILGFVGFTMVLGLIVNQVFSSSRLAKGSIEL